MSVRSRARRWLLLVLALLACSSPAAARVASTSLEQLARGADLVVIGTDREFHEVGGWRVMTLDVERVIGEAAGDGPARVHYLADGSWTCDTSDGEPGERVLLFTTAEPLDGAIWGHVWERRGPHPTELDGEPVYRVYWHGRGRIPVVASDVAAAEPELELGFGVAVEGAPAEALGAQPRLTLAAALPVIEEVRRELRLRRRATVIGWVIAAPVLLLFALRGGRWFVRRMATDLRELRALGARERDRRWLVLGWRVGLGIALAFTLFSGLGFLAAGHRMRVADAAWAEVNRSTAELLARYPATETNASAVELERLVARLGLDLADYDLKGRPRPASFPNFRSTRLADSAKRAVRASLDDPSSRIPVPEPELRERYAARRAELDAVVHHLLEAERPTWFQDIENPLGSEFFEIAQYGYLVELLLFDGLERMRVGDDAGALESLTAVEHLAEAVLAWPGSATSFSATIWVRRLAAVGRKRPGLLPDDWLEEYQGEALRLRVVDDIQVARLEAERLHRHNPYDLHVKGDAGAAVEELRSPTWAVAFLALAPYFRLDGAWNYLDGVAYAQAARFRPACAEGRGDPPYAGRAGPWWLHQLVPVGAAQVSSPASLGDMRVADSARLQVELTRKVIALERAHAETGAWPDPTPGIAATFCAEGSWIYEPRPDGGMSISFRRAVDGSSGSKPFHQYLRYEHPVGEET